MELLDANSGCIMTNSKILVNVFEPTEDMFIIEDIAHALSHECRFGGHLPRFYSVAQHSVNCMLNVSSEHKLAALLHDASEAYLRDIPTPIKTRLSGYKELEDAIMTVIASKFKFQWPMSKEVKEVDSYMLNVEWDNLVKSNNPNFKTYTPETARAEFLIAYEKLTK